MSVIKKLRDFRTNSRKNLEVFSLMTCIYDESPEAVSKEALRRIFIQKHLSAIYFGSYVPVCLSLTF